MAHDELDKGHELKPRLYLPSGVHGGGFVLLAKDGQEISVEFSVGQVEVLLAFNQALAADGHLARDASGWRSPAWVSSVLSYAMEEGSVRRSVSRINKVFREAMTKKHPNIRLPALLTCKRGLGIRLAWPLQVLLPDPQIPAIHSIGACHVRPRAK